MSRARLIGAVVLAVIAVIVVLQNTQTVETRLLFFSVSAPRAALLFVTLLIGFVIGALVTLRLRGPKRDS